MRESFRLVFGSHKAWLLSSAGMVLLSGAVLAQTPPKPASSAVEDVVVTAQHKKENAKNVPITVTKLNAKRIEELSSDGEDIRALSAEVPSLYAESSFGRTFPRFYIRGLGNSDYTYNAQQPVSVVYDDVVEENSVLKAFPMFDVEDVEVLAGPQGTLFGRNTPAGVIKIDSVKPSDDYNGYVSVGDGTYNTANFTAAVGGAIVPQKLDFRIAIQDEHRDNWITNLNPDPKYQKHLEGYNDFAIKVSLLFKPQDDLDMLLEADDRQLNGTARVFRADIIEQGTNKLVPGFKIDEVDINGDDTQQEGQFGTHFTVNYDAGPVKVTSISAWEHAQTFSRGDVDGGNYQVAPPLGQAGTTGFDDETSDAIPSLDQLSEEIRVSTTGNGPYYNQGGIYLFHENLRVDSLDYTTSGTPDISIYQRQATSSIGIFDSATYKVTPDLTLGAGVRVSSDHKAYSVACDYTCTVPTPSLLHAHYTGPSFNVNGVYAVTPDTNIYARVATGYLAPALDGRNIEYDFGFPAGNAFSTAKAETTISYEVGTKTSMLNNRVVFDADLYRWDTHDLQLTAVGGDGPGNQLLNAKNALGEGFEAKIDTRPTDNLIISGSASYNFTEILDPGLITAGCGSGLCTVLNESAGNGNYYINHNPLPNAPRWVFDARARYTYPITDGTDVYLSTDWSYRSSVNFFLYEATEFKGAPLLQGGLRIGYEDHIHGYEIAAYARNLLNEIRITGAIDFDNLTGFVNDPRIIGVQAKVKF